MSIDRFRALPRRQRAYTTVKTLRRLGLLITGPRELTDEEAAQIHPDDWPYARPLAMTYGDISERTTEYAVADMLRHLEPTMLDAFARGIMRPPWWKRALIWLGLMKQPPLPEALRHREGNVRFRRPPPFQSRRETMPSEDFTTRVIDHPATAPAFLELKLIANFTGVTVMAKAHPSSSDLMGQRADEHHFPSLDEALECLPGFCRGVIADRAAAAAKADQGR